MHKNKLIWISTSVANILFVTAFVILISCSTSLGVTLFGAEGAVFLARGEHMVPFMFLIILVLVSWSAWQIYRNKLGRIESPSGELVLPLKLKLLLWIPVSLLLLVLTLLVLSLLSII